MSSSLRVHQDSQSKAPAAIIAVAPWSRHPYERIAQGAPRDARQVDQEKSASFVLLLASRCATNRARCLSRMASVATVQSCCGGDQP